MMRDVSPYVDIERPLLVLIDETDGVVVKGGIAPTSVMPFVAAQLVGAALGWVLVRGDYGFVLDRREGERHGRFYFSIGQAF